jgi:hypothetical protein
MLVAIALALALVGSGGGSGSPALDSSPRFVEASDLTSLEGTLGHPIYWAGERAGERLELTSEADGSVYLRYLPPGVAVGESPATYLTVGTYPVAAAQEAVRRAAVEAGQGVARVAGGGIVFADRASSGSAYLAYPDSDLQIEVYDPVPGRAIGLIRSGSIRPVGEG